MIIKLFARDLELIRVDENAKNLDLGCAGKTFYTENKAYFDGDNAFNVCLHEIFHFYIERAGFNQMEEFSKEVVCDMFATCCEQLILENGDDFFIKLEKFANKTE